MTIQRGVGRRDFAGRQRGAMAVLVGVLIVALMGFGGLVIDLGRMYVTKTELQSAMDACALAAANQLQPGPGATQFVLDAAAAHGRAMVSGGRNMAYFQSRAVVPADVQIEFSGSLSGPYSSGDPVTARFVRCTYPMDNIVVTLTRVLNLIPTADAIASTTTVGATAVASRAPIGTGDPTNFSTCGLFPVAVCRAPGGSAANNWGMTPGQWIGGVAQTGGGGGGGSVSLGPGNYGWIDFSPPGGGAGELLGLLKGSGACGSIPIGTPVGQTGQISSAIDGWNTRFGIYANGGGLSEAVNPPDYTGYSYSRSSYIPAAAWTAGSTAAINAFRNDYPVRRMAASVFNQTEVGYANNHFNARMSTIQQLRDYGRLRRVVPAPVVDCSLFSGGSFPPIEGYACLFLLRPYKNSGPTPSFEDRTDPAFSPEIEYLGTLDEIDTPCRLTGGGGGGGGGSTGGGLSLVPRLVQ